MAEANEAPASGGSKKTTGRWPIWRRRLRRVLLWSAGVLLGLVALVALVIVVPGLRTAVLHRAVPLIDKYTRPRIVGHLKPGGTS